MESSYNKSDISKSVKYVGSFPQGSVLRVCVADGGGGWSRSRNIEITIKDELFVKNDSGPETDPSNYFLDPFRPINYNLIQSI